MLSDLSAFNTGPQLQKALREHGLTRCHVTKDRITNHYLVRFYEQMLPGYVKPAEHWIPQLQEIIPDAAIVGSQNVCATWQPEKPVITASIWLDLPKTSEKDTLILAFIILANQAIALFEKFIASFIWLSIEARRVLFRQWLNRSMNHPPLLPAPKIAGLLPAPKSKTPISEAIWKYGAQIVVAAIHTETMRVAAEAEKTHWIENPPMDETFSLADLPEPLDVPKYDFNKKSS